MKESKTTEFTYYTGNLNITSFGGDPDAEATFHVYRTTRGSDGSAVVRRIGHLNCTEPQLKKWLELKEKIDKDRMHRVSLGGIFDRVKRLFKTD